MRQLVLVTPGGALTPLLSHSESLPGGSAGQETFALSDETCVYDLVVDFRDSPPLTIHDWNVCRLPVMPIGKVRCGAHRSPLVMASAAAGTMEPASMSVQYLQTRGVASFDYVPLGDGNLHGHTALRIVA